MKPELEIRRCHEVRSELENDKPVLSGYAVKWNSLSHELEEDGMRFRERVLPGAFAESLVDHPDVRFLAHHDERYIVARRSKDTLKLTEDDYGLRFLAYLNPRSTKAIDLHADVEWGNLDEMSFGFNVVEERFVEEEGVKVREIVKATLDEISCVVWPAYPDATSVKVRSGVGKLARRSETRAVDRLRLKQTQIEIEIELGADR